MRRVVTGVALLLGLLAVAASASQTILGKSFVVKDPSPGVDATKRKVVALGKELASPDTVVGDPVANGATIEIIANGASPTSQVFTLPAGAYWTVITSGFKYVDKLGVNGPVKVALIKKAPSGVFLVKAVIVGLLGPGPQPHITVLPPNAGTDGGMIFTIPGGDSYCVAFGGAAAGLVVNSTNKVFKVSAPLTSPTVEAGCPAAAVTTTTTTTSSTTTTLPVSFATDVQPIFTARCAMPGCHVPVIVPPIPPAGGQDLSAGNSYAQLVNYTTQTILCPLPAGVKRVDPGSPATSYLIEKLNGAGPCFVGLVMPAVPTGFTPAEQATITNWILQGALNN